MTLSLKKTEYHPKKIFEGAMDLYTGDKDDDLIIKGKGRNLITEKGHSLITEMGQDLVTEKGHDLVPTHSFPLVKVDLTCYLPSIELIKLYRTIEQALAPKRHIMVQFISPTNEQGVSDIALQTAIIAARLVGKRVLFIDTATALADKKEKTFGTKGDTSLETLLQEGAPPYEAISRAVGTELYFARLFKQGEEGMGAVSLTTIENALEKLKTYFEVIIIDSRAILKDAFSMGLAKVADGAVMIVEAERTRAPVAMECKRLIEVSGGRLIGAVMNKRCKYIPEAIYRQLYQRDTL